MFCEEEGTGGRKASCEVGAAATETSSREEKRGAIQETLRRENELALALDQMGNSKAEGSLGAPSLPIWQRWRRSTRWWRIKNPLLSFEACGTFREKGERHGSTSREFREIPGGGL